MVSVSKHIDCDSLCMHDAKIFTHSEAKKQGGTIIKAGAITGTNTVWNYDKMSNLKNIRSMGTRAHLAFWSIKWI